MWTNNVLLAELLVRARHIDGLEGQTLTARFVPVLAARLGCSSEEMYRGKGKERQGGGGKRTRFLNELCRGVIPISIQESLGHPQAILDVVVAYAATVIIPMP